jgi:hypothetical protein
MDRSNLRGGSFSLTIGWFIIECSNLINGEKLLGIFILQFSGSSVVGLGIGSGQGNGGKLGIFIRQFSSASVVGLGIGFG